MRWVIIDEEDAPTVLSASLQPVLELPFGVLYRNLNSACETDQPPESAPSG
ncbi:MAG: hypothetical protein SNJ80_05375 [Anaerolinea sp.]